MASITDSIKRTLRDWIGAAPASGTPGKVFASTQYGGIDWDEWVRGNFDAEGAISETTARSVSAVVACTNLIGGSIASLPLHLYRREGDDRVAYKDDTWWLLNERPFASWSAAGFWQYLSDSRLFHGDAFARIHRAARLSPKPAGFEPLHPQRVRVTRARGGWLSYTIMPAFPGEATVTVEQDDMLHVTGPGFDGLRSMSQLQYGLRNSVGVSRSADSQAATLMADGVRPDFAIEVPGSQSREQIDTLRRTFMDRTRGQNTARVPVVMAGGIKLHPLTMTSKDAELLATRGFQIEEVCRVFGVPPFMVGHTEKTTSWGSGVSEMSLGFIKYTLQRHLVAFEQEINFKLFKTSRNFSEFVTAGLERGDLKGRSEAYRIALGRAGELPWMTPNEVRKLENLPQSDEFDLPEPPEAPDPNDPADPEGDAPATSTADPSTTDPATPGEGPAT